MLLNEDRWHENNKRMTVKSIDRAKERIWDDEV